MDSGLTVQEYSKLKELPYESVRRWIRRLKQERTEDAKVDFVEVKAPSVPISTGASGIRLKFGGGGDRVGFGFCSGNVIGSSGCI